MTNKIGKYEAAFANADAELAKAKAASPNMPELLYVDAWAVLPGSYGDDCEEGHRAGDCRNCAQTATGVTHND